MKNSLNHLIQNSSQNHGTILKNSKLNLNNVTYHSQPALDLCIKVYANPINDRIKPNFNASES